jgi:hypothetical protein
MGYTARHHQQHVYEAAQLNGGQLRRCVVQSVADEESVRKQREEMLVTFVRDKHSGLREER